MDLVNPFSVAKDVAQFIRSQLRSQPGEPRLVAGFFYDEANSTCSGPCCPALGW